MLKQLKATFAHTTSACLFLINSCYNYIMAIIETMLLIFIAYHVASAAGFLAFTSNISIFGGTVSILLSLVTPYIKENLSDNGFFGYITPIALMVLISAFFACVFTGYGLYACYVGVVLLAIVRPLRYTFYTSFMNSTWKASDEEVRSLQGFNGTFSARPAKWVAALVMIIFTVTATISGNMLFLAASIVLSSIVWLVAVYYTPKNKFKKKSPSNDDEKDPAGESLDNKGDTIFGIKAKYVYWSIIVSIAIVCSTFLHLLKDIINAKLIGVALLPAMRFWISLPTVMVFYALASTIKDCYLENNRYFEVTLLLFGVVFIAFAVLFPYSAILQGFMVPSFLPTIAGLMLQNWFLISFSMFCEMWTPIIANAIVYPLQNEYFDQDEIFTVIPKICILQSVGEIFAGTAMHVMSSYQLPMTTVITAVIVFILLSIATMTYVHNRMYSSGCVKPKYLFQEHMQKIASARQSCLRALIALACFGLGIGALVYGYTPIAATLMLLSAATYMSKQVEHTWKLYSDTAENTAAKSDEIKQHEDNGSLLSALSLKGEESSPLHANRQR